MSSTPIFWIVVDATSLTEHDYWVWASVMKQKINHAKPEKKITWIYSPPGLTRQRNRGIEFALKENTSIFHFLDDDVLPNLDYFDEMTRVFELHTDLLGATGKRLGEVMPKTDTRRSIRNSYEWIIQLLRGKFEEGKVSRSGQNFLTYGSQPRRVDWLSGCSMSFSRAVFLSNRFDESFDGYSLMEDLDFTYRVSLQGPLLYWPAAQVTHTFSQVNRWPAYKSFYVEANNRTVFLLKHRKHFSFFRHLALYFVESSAFSILGFLKFKISYLQVGLLKPTGLVRGILIKRYL